MNKAEVDALWDEYERKHLVPQAYAKLDHYLRNNLDDVDYAEYSQALDVVLSASATRHAKSRHRCADRRRKEMSKRVEVLQHVVEEMYIVAGALGADERVLDQLLAAVDDEPLPHKSLLPYEPGADERAGVPTYRCSNVHVKGLSDGNVMVTMLAKAFEPAPEYDVQPVNPAVVRAAAPTQQQLDSKD